MSDSHPQSEIPLIGVVLCGGRSRRMGFAKALLPFGDETMLQRIVRILSSRTPHMVVVSRPDLAIPEIRNVVTVLTNVKIMDHWREFASDSRKPIPRSGPRWRLSPVVMCHCYKLNSLTLCCKVSENTASPFRLTTDSSTRCQLFTTPIFSGN